MDPLTLDFCDERDQLGQTFDAYGTETRNEFDALGHTTKTKVAIVTALAMVSETEFDPDG